MSDKTGATEAEIIARRRAHLEELRAGGRAYPNDVRRDTLAQEIHREFTAADAGQLAELAKRVTLAGRMMNRRIMGKAAFVDLQDLSGRIQLYVRRDDLPPGCYDEFKKWDLGDLVAAEGTVYRTNKGELSVKVDELRLVTKSLRPLPDKYHGLAEQEARYRQRYLDLLVNDGSRRIFLVRSRIIDHIRNFLAVRGFTEVETPMMQVLPGGAAARPFVTHHNALDMTLYLRIAPELYLKRLVIGGMERVFEINRSFRNEGLSTRHNPEFTMLEFYQAYADYNDAMDLTDQLMAELAAVFGDAGTVTYQGARYDLSKAARRLSLKESIIAYNVEFNPRVLNDLDAARRFAESIGIPIKEHYGLGKVLVEIFEKTVEGNLTEPTFITGYPAETSPLARCNEEDPFITDRFEYFVGGREIANGFSELNDPDMQAERFKAQAAAKDSGDEEAMTFDADYIRALEYGMPPTAGEGIGIDRLVMLFTDCASIRDVILFPHLRRTDHGGDNDNTD